MPIGMLPHCRCCNQVGSTELDFSDVRGICDYVEEVDADHSSMVKEGFPRARNVLQLVTVGAEIHSV